MKISYENCKNLRFDPKYNHWTIGDTDNNRKKYILNYCYGCGRLYLANKKKFKKGMNIFCSKSCASSGENNPNHGKKHSEETRKKMSKNHYDVSGKNNPNYGGKWSDDKKKKLSRHHKITKNSVGSKNPAWKGGYAKNNIPMYYTYILQLSPYGVECRRSPDDKNILEVKCTYCDKWYIPTKVNVDTRIQVIKGYNKISGERRFYCSDQCKRDCPVFNQIKYRKGEKPYTSRPDQSALRAIVLERDDYKCQICGSTKNLRCHHYDGIEINPIESADPDMCVTLCKKCHIEKAHKDIGCRPVDMACNKNKIIP
jgi:5-methylcytosine-specific restriction endonuclease McrA